MSARLAAAREVEAALAPPYVHRWLEPEQAGYDVMCGARAYPYEPPFGLPRAPYEALPRGTFVWENVTCPRCLQEQR